LGEDWAKLGNIGDKIEIKTSKEEEIELFFVKCQFLIEDKDLLIIFNIK